MYAAILAKTRQGIIEDDSKAIAEYRVKARLLEGGRTSLSAQSSDPTSFEAAVGPNLGLGCSLEKRGEKIGMAPGEMYLGSVASCVAVAFAVQADIMNIHINDVSVEVTGYVDMRGILDIDPSVETGFNRLTMNVLIDSAASHEEVLRMAKKVDEKSPILCTARKAVKVESQYSHNGRALNSVC
ncbi:MAG: OsmC family protein [Nitrospinota bacterium]|nr:OsmC family protein [Nitrospinota bacterium]MDH5756915.1 OsmC family protein [Nitrospinota bacterium]